MKIFTEKAFTNFTKPLTGNYRQKSAWLSASFGYELMYYKTVLRHPEDYYNWAEKSAADRVIGYFKELCNHDFLCAKMLYNSYCHELWDLVRKTYKLDNPVDYFQFYYRKEVG